MYALIRCACTVSCCCVRACARACNALNHAWHCVRACARACNALSHVWHLPCCVLCSVPVSSASAIGEPNTLEEDTEARTASRHLLSTAIPAFARLADSMRVSVCCSAELTRGMHAAGTCREVPAKHSTRAGEHCTLHFLAPPSLPACNSVPFV